MPDDHHFALPRRDLIKAGLAGGLAGGLAAALPVGYARAALPVNQDSIIHTPSTGLIAGEVSIPATDRALPAYRAVPQNAIAAPVILIIHEVFGVHEWIRDICRRFAHLGAFAIAVDLYNREGNTTELTEVGDIIKIVTQVPDAQVSSDLDATLAFARSQAHVDQTKLGVTGFCWGGRQTWLYAEHNPKVTAAVAWYGPLAGEGGALRPKSAIDYAGDLKVPVLGLYGGDDNNIPASDIDAMRAHLPAGKPSEIKVYQHTPHGFFADYRTSYRPEEAADGWKNALAWFRKYGVLAG